MAAQTWEVWKKENHKEFLQTGADSGSGGASPWEKWKKENTFAAPEQKRKTVREKYMQASGMDDFRKDFGTYASYGIVKEEANRQWAQNIQKQRDYFSRYASHFSQEELTAFNEELDLYESVVNRRAERAKLQEYQANQAAYRNYTEQREKLYGEEGLRADTQLYKKPATAAKLAQNGDPKAQELVRKQNAYEAIGYQQAVETAEAYIAGGGTTASAFEAYQAEEKAYRKTAEGYFNAVSKLNAYVDAFIQSVQNSPAADALRRARDKDLANGVKLGDGIIYTEYTNFFAAAIESEWMDADFVPEELSKARQLTQGYEAEKTKLEAASNENYAMWLYQLKKAYEDENFGKYSEVSKEYAQEHGRDKGIGAAYAMLYDLQTGADSVLVDRGNNGGRIRGVKIPNDELCRMTKEERALFFYYCNTGDTDMAELFLVSIADDLARRTGEDYAKAFDYPFVREAAATVAGVANGAKNLGYGIGSIFADIEPPRLDSSDYMVGTLQEKHDKSLAGYAINTGYNIGNMAPSIAGYAVNPTIGLSATFLSARGNAYIDAKRNGYTHGQAWAYSTLVGASEAFLEKLLGAMGGFAKGKITSKVSTAMNKKITGIAGRLVKEFALNASSELLEENVQNYLEPAFAMLVGAADHYEAPDFDDFLETSIVTFMTTSAFFAVQTPSKIKQLKFNDQMGRFADAAMKADKNSDIYKEGAKLRQMLDSGENITGEYMQGVFERLGTERYATISLTQNSTAVDDNPETHTTEELQNIEAYKNAVDADLVQFAEDSKKGGKANDTYQLSDVNEKTASDIKAITGIDVSGFHTAIERRQIWHIGDNGKANQSMSDVNDVGRIQYVIDNYDTVTLGGKSSSYTTVKENGKAGQAPVVLFSKKIGGTYYVVEAVPNTKRKTLFVTSAFITQSGQKETGTLQLVNAPKSPVETPEASSASIPVTNSVSRFAQTVNKDVRSAEYENSGLIYETLVDFGVHKAAAESLAKSYDPADGISPEIYARGAAEAFFYGKGSLPEAELRNGKDLSPILTELQRSAAYRLGQIFRENQISKEETAIAQKKVAAKKSGGAARSQKGNVHYDGDRSNLSERQKVSVRALEKLAQAIGIDFYLYESERDAAGKPVGANGWYDQKTGDIHIDLNAGEFGEGTILFTAAHELTHFLRQWSPSKFKVLSDFLVEQYGTKGQPVADLVRNQQAKAKRNGRSLSWTQAYEEMIADSMETMLSDGTVIKKLTELSAKDKGLVQKILDWFKGFAAKLKRAYKDLPADSAEGRFAAEMTDTIDRLQILFTEGLTQAGENYRAADSIMEMDDIKLSAREMSSFQSCAKMIDAVVKMAIENHGKIGEAYNQKQISPVQNNLANMVAIASEGNIDITTKYIALNGDDIWHAYNRHTDVQKETDRGQIAFTLRQFMNAIKAVYAPDVVESLIPTHISGTIRQSFAYAKRTKHGHYIVVEAVGGRKNPNLVPVEIIQVSKAKWAQYMSQGKTLGEMLYENSPEKLAALDIAANKRSRVTATQFASKKAIAHTSHSPQLTHSIPENLQTVNKNNGSIANAANAQTLASTLEMTVEPASIPNVTHTDQNSNSPDNTSNFGEPHSDRGNLTTHVALMQTDASEVKNAIERKYLKEYQEMATRQFAEQQKLDKLQAELDALSKDKRRTSRARFLRDEIIKTKNRIKICQSIQTRLETNSPLTYLIRREIKPHLAETQKIAMPQTQAKTTTLSFGQNNKSDFVTEQNKHGQERQPQREQLTVAESPKSDIITSRAAAASIYVNSNTDLFRNAKRISPIEGYEDIVIHGSKYGFEIRNADDKPIGIYSVNEFCDILQDDPNYHGGAIRLISCEAGANGSFVAQGLANRLGVVVLAPTDTVWVFPDGSMVIGEDEFTNSGEWREFLPQRKR